MALLQLLMMLTLLLGSPSPSTEQDPSACPAGFNSTMGRCLLFNLTARVSWCDANRACASVGAELLTNWPILAKLSSIIPNTEAWVGVSDLANERATNKDGWQLVNGRGILSTDSNLWIPGDPNNNGGQQDCVLLSFNANYNAMIDKECDYTGAGYVCELPDVPNAPVCAGSVSSAGRARWIPAPAALSTEVNNPSKYCFTELRGVASLRDCAVQASYRLLSRSFLYSSASGICHIVEFTDSQTQLALQPAMWIKYVKD